ncbi:hypothetical protein RBWH47_01622 [Rhodopirellula baltica WH47]|uniref:Uncharacterized protein n=1 Tax=Rhodopirellula baltica WH47 TaxID=991778 RepID=F2AZK6_RHOBT|nr:hypothetical protein RBWH47_01622 [Rhodopirellula baltica WH47]
MVGIEKLLGRRDRLRIGIERSGGLPGLVTAERLANAGPVNLQPHGGGLGLQAFADAGHGVGAGNGVGVGQVGGGHDGWVPGLSESTKNAPPTETIDEASAKR